MSFFFTLCAFLLAMLLLVAVHELGHYLAARYFGVKVLKFSIGFGRPIKKFTDKLGTDFIIGILPLGGYVKMLDEREAPVANELLPFAFNQQSLYKKSIIVLAGPLANFLFAAAVFWLMFMMGISGMVPRVGAVLPNSPASQAGIVAGDTFFQVNQSPANTWQKVIMHFSADAQGQGKVISKLENAAGHSKQVALQMPTEFEPGAILRKLGILTAMDVIPAKVGEIVNDSAAQIAGIQPGDLITELNHKPLMGWFELVDRIKENPGIELSLTIKRASEILDINIVPHKEDEMDGADVGVIGVILDDAVWPDELFTTEQYGPLEAFNHALVKTALMTRMTLTMIGKMLTQADIHHLGGPISIAKGAGESAEVGLEYYFGFLGLISISLAVINLLPIPLLDGGHLLYYAIEGLTGRPISELVQRIGLSVGLVVLLGIMSLALYNDLTGLSH